MADARFHDRSQPHLLAAIAAASECSLANPADAQYSIDDVAPLDQAGATQLSFLNNLKYRDQFTASKAGACIVSVEAAAFAPEGMRILIAKDPYRSYALAATLFYPHPTGNGIIAETAVIGANLGKNCSVGHHAVIHEGATIGDNCHIESGAIIGAGVELGDGCWIGANASLTHCVLGKGVRIHAGARIGQDGFGFAMGPKGHLPVPQLGRVMIGHGVNIGANTTVDRGAGPDTVIGDGCVIDNLVQIAHNVRMGRGCVIAAQVGIAGSSTLGDFVVMGGQVGVAGHLTIGSGARIAAQSGVTKNVPAGQEWVGFPAAPRRAYWREQVRLKKLLGE